MDDDTNNGPPERDELIAELGRVGGLLDCLAALVLTGDIRAARSMAEAMRGGEVEGATRLDLGDERPKLTGWAVQHLATMLAAHLDEFNAVNHCAWTVHFPAHGEKPARDLDLVAQWSGGVTTAGRIAQVERERGALHAAARAVAAAQLDHDRDPSDATRAALDVALTALFALVPAEVTRDAPPPPLAPAVRAPDGGGTGEGGPDATAGAAEALARCKRTRDVWRIAGLPPGPEAVARVEREEAAALSALAARVAAEGGA